VKIAAERQLILRQSLNQLNFMLMTRLLKELQRRYHFEYKCCHVETAYGWKMVWSHREISKNRPMLPYNDVNDHDHNHSDRTIRNSFNNADHTNNTKEDDHYTRAYHHTMDQLAHILSAAHSQEPTADIHIPGLHYPLYSCQHTAPSTRSGTHRGPNNNSNNNNNKVLRILRFIESECAVLPSKNRCPYVVVAEVLQQDYDYTDDRVFTSASTQSGSFGMHSLEYNADADFVDSEEEHLDAFVDATTPLIEKDSYGDGITNTGDEEREDDYSDFVNGGSADPTPTVRDMKFTKAIVATTSEKDKPGAESDPTTREQNTTMRCEGHSRRPLHTRSHLFRRFGHRFKPLLNKQHQPQAFQETKRTPAAAISKPIHGRPRSPELSLTDYNAVTNTQLSHIPLPLMPASTHALHAHNNPFPFAYSRASMPVSNIQPQQRPQQSILVRKHFKPLQANTLLANKQQFYRQVSPFAHLPNWALQAFIVKSGDEFRREVVAMQVIAFIQQLFRSVPSDTHAVAGSGSGTGGECVDVCLRTYDIICMKDNSCGFIEFLDDAHSIDEIKKSYLGEYVIGPKGHAQPNMTVDSTVEGQLPMQPATLKDYFIHKFGPTTSLKHAHAVDNFVRSLAGYSLITYVLQVN
jgi:hypothetical protein